MAVTGILNGQLVGRCAIVGTLALVAGPALSASFASDRIAVSVKGQGSDIVLIPGLGGSTAIWADLARRLEGHRVHEVQVLGFAGAPPQANDAGPLLGPIAEEIGRYLDEEELEDAILIGHSMGGLLALSVAAEADLAGLVLVDAPPALGGLLAGSQASPEDIRGMADAMRAGMEAADEAGWAEQATALVGGMVEDPGARAAVLGDYLASDRDTVTRAFHELVVTDLRPILPAVEEPASVIYVAGPVPPEQIDAFYRAAYAGLGSADFTRIEDAAHYVMLDNPEAFAAAVIEAIDGF